MLNRETLYQQDKMYNIVLEMYKCQTPDIIRNINIYTFPEKLTGFHTCSTAHD